MGRSKNISEMAKQNEEFKTFVTSMRKDLDAEVGKQRELIEQEASKHYKPYGNDDVSMLSSAMAHQCCVSEWNLDVVNDMIKSCRDAILGGPKPEGATAKGSAEATASISRIDGINELIAGAAFDAVQGLLRGIGSRTSVETKSQFTSRLLAPGLRLFISVIENSYDKKHFFGRESIMQSIFVFDARYSTSEGKKQAEMTGLMALSNLLEGFAGQLDQVSLEITKIKIGDSDYMLKMTQLLQISQFIQKNMDDIQAKIAALGGKPNEHGDARRLNRQVADGLLALSTAHHRLLTVHTGVEVQQ